MCSGPFSALVVLVATSMIDSKQSMKLIVGLGNPRTKFSQTRHNIGFECVDHMARKWNIVLSDRRAKAVLGQGHVRETPVVLAKPRTFMNRSGEGIVYLQDRFAAGPESLVVVYDEMDLPTGKIRIRPGGSSAGHNGMKSIISALGTQEFTRIRVGIGKPVDDVDAIDHVLGGFSPQAKSIMTAAVETVAEAVECIIHDGVDVAMNRYN